MTDDEDEGFGGEAAGIGLVAETAANVAVPGLGSLIAAGSTLLGIGTKVAGAAGTISATKQFASAEAANAAQYNTVAQGIYGQQTDIARQQTVLAGQANQTTRGITQAELALEANKRNAMELDVNRKQLENARNVQGAAANARLMAAASGSAYGSELEQATGAIAAEGGYGAQGLSQSRQLGETAFAGTAAVSQGRLNLGDITLASQTLGYQSDILRNQLASVGNLYNLSNAQAKAQYATAGATAQGISAIGGALLQGAPAMGRLFSGPNTNPSV